jgi:hypothetical protein
MVDWQKFALRDDFIEVEKGGGGSVKVYGKIWPMGYSILTLPSDYTSTPKIFSLQAWMVWLSIAAMLETHFNLSNSEQLWYLHLRSKPVTMYTSTALTCRCLRIYTWNIAKSVNWATSRILNGPGTKSRIKKQCCGSGSGIWDLGTTTTFRVIFPPITAGIVVMACVMLVSTAP